MAEYFKKDGDDYVKVDDTLLSQGEVDKVVETRLERQKKQYADYDDLKEKAGKVDTITKDFETKLKEAGDKHTDLEKQLGVAKLETDKVKIVSEFKLSDELAEFVTGETADEMRERAEKLSKGVGGGKVVINKDGKKKPDDTDSKKIAKSLFGGSKSDD